MWWKTVIRWLRDRLDLDVDLDVGGGKVAVTVTVKAGEMTVLTERFEWPLPALGETVKLVGTAARRRRMLPEAG